MLLLATLLVTTVGTALGSPAIQAAAEAEAARAMSLQLPEQPAPYRVEVAAIDGTVATATGSFGALTSDDEGPYRNLRVEVRVGGYALDNANFQVGFGDRDGVRSRWLPHEDHGDALLREMWLALDEAYKGAAEQLSSKLSAREGRPVEADPEIIALEPLVIPLGEIPAVDPERVRHTARTLSARLTAWPQFEDGDAIMRDWQGQRLIVSTEGLRAGLPTGFTVVRAEAILRTEDGSRLQNARSWVARTADQLPSLDEMSAEVDEMASWLAALEDAPVEENYLGPVLFEQTAAVELFRQLLAPELCGSPPPEEAPDPYSEQQSAPPRARIGRRLLPEGWMVIDDAPSWPQEAGSYSYDFDGIPPRAVTLVDNGVVRDVLMSRIPREGLGASTGHGRSLGADRRQALPAVVQVTPRRSRSDTRLRRRALNLAEQAGLPYVLVIRRLQPPALAEGFDIAFTGDAPLAGLTAPMEALRLYADGREEPVRGLQFIGVDRRVLRDIAMAGAVGAPAGVMDAAPGAQRYNIGAVGGLPATWIVPPVVITELELRGVAGGEPRQIPIPPPR